MSVTQVSETPWPLPAGLYSHYLGPQETGLLIQLVQSVSPKVMIEFGCNLGITARWVLDKVPSLERYVGIDVPPTHVPTLRCQIDEVPEEAGRYVVDQRFFLLLQPSLELSADSLEPCDAVFIDGDHSYKAVVHESKLAREVVRPGGIIVWHDFQNPAVEVTQALTELDWPIMSLRGSWLAFMRIEER